MRSFARLTAFVVAIFTAGVLASIGPVTDLHIVNANIAPDGFTRATVLAGGTFPGPLIVGQKVGAFVCHCRHITDSILQGDNFQINVIDELTDPNQLLTTTIVSTGHLNC